MTQAEPAAQQHAGAGPPWWCWLLLAAAVCAMSSAGVGFAFLRDVPPLTLAGWRLQSTAAIISVAGALQWRYAMQPDARRRAVRDLGYTALSGAALAVHFATWVWSLQATSLAHSLLLVSTSPVINVCAALVMRHAISRGEVLGSLLAFLGCGVLAAGAVAGHESSVTLAGDAAAFAAALAVCVHWHVGRHLRDYQPVFVYSAPVTLIAAALLTLAGVALETRSLLGRGNDHTGAFGWLLSRHHAPIVMYLGTVPGILGHQGTNTCLKYVSPLIISLVIQAEPLLGPLLGYLCHVAAAPGLLTYVGGAIVLSATLLATVASARRQQAEAAALAEQLRSLKHKSLSLPPHDGDAAELGAAAGSDAAADDAGEHVQLLLAARREQELSAGSSFTSEGGAREREGGA